MIKEYFLKNGESRYEYNIYLGIDPLTNKEVRKRKKGFKTKRDAELAEAKVLIDFEENGFSTAPKNATYRDVYEMWLDNYQSSVKESTLHKTLTMFRIHILPAFAEYKINNINSIQCEQTVKNWANELRKFKEVKNYASMVFDYAVRHDFIKENPMDRVDIKNIKTEKFKNEKVFFDKEELENFLQLIHEKAPYRWKAFFHLLAYTGMRKGEMLALYWSDVDFEEQTLNISKTLTRGLDNRVIVQDTKTENGMRKITLDDTTLKVLKIWKQKQTETLFQKGINVNQSADQLIFNNDKNKFMSDSAPNSYLTKFLKNNNLKHVNIHSFRHTHITLLFEAGAKIKEVQNRVGHTDLETTMNIYTHVTQKAEKDTVQKFAKYMDN